MSDVCANPLSSCWIIHLTPSSPKTHPLSVSISGAGNSAFGLLARHLRSMDSSRRETRVGLLKYAQSSNGSRAIASNRSSCGRLAKPPFSPLPTALWRRQSRAILLLGLVATSATLSAPYNGRGSSAAGVHHHRAADQLTPPPVSGDMDSHIPAPRVAFFRHYTGSE